MQVTSAARPVKHPVDQLVDQIGDHRLQRECRTRRERSVDEPSEPRVFRRIVEECDRFLAVRTLAPQRRKDFDVLQSGQNVIVSGEAHELETAAVESVYGTRITQPLVRGRRILEVRPGERVVIDFGHDHPPPATSYCLATGRLASGST